MRRGGRRRLAIIGHFGGGKDYFDGQTIKTKTLYDELIRAGVKDIVKVDTWFNKTSKLRLLADTAKAIMRCDTFILLLSRGGLSAFLPIFYVVKKISGKHVYLDVIGGNTAELIGKNPTLGKYMAKFDSVWPETRLSQTDLESIGIVNTVVIPNFKRLDMASRAGGGGDSLRFCTFSRVTREKGIVEAIEAVSLCRSRLETEQLYLDIWGPVEDEFKKDFDDLCRKYSDFVSYGGCVPYGDSVQTLQNEDVLLFPTRWEGEGFPGTLVDAFSAGIPVIASDWNANSEIVTPFMTGLIYPSREFQGLADAIEWCVKNKHELRTMGQACLDEAEKYMPTNWIQKIIEMTGLMDAAESDEG